MQSTGSTLIVGFFGKKQYADNAPSRLTMKLSNQLCLECSIGAMFLSSSFTVSMMALFLSSNLSDTDIMAPFMLFLSLVISCQYRLSEKMCTFAHVLVMMFVQALQSYIGQVGKRSKFSDLLSFSFLPHHRTCRSAYGGFVLILSLLDSAYWTSSLLLYCQDTPYRLEKRVPLRTSDYYSFQIHRLSCETKHDSALRLDQLVVGYFSLC